MLGRNSEILIYVGLAMLVVALILVGVDIIHQQVADTSKNVAALISGSKPVTYHPTFTAKLFEKIIYWAKLLFEIFIPIFVVIKYRMFIANVGNFVHHLLEKVIILTFYNKRLLFFKNQ